MFIKLIHHYIPEYTAFPSLYTVAFILFTLLADAATIRGKHLFEVMIRCINRPPKVVLSFMIKKSIYTPANTVLT